MSTKHRKVKRKFLLSIEELKIIDNMMMSNDVESRLLGLSLLETSALGKHYFAKGKIQGVKLSYMIDDLRCLLYRTPVSLLKYNIFLPNWVRVFNSWIISKTY